MAFDVAKHAIQLELELDAAASFDSLNELERKVVNVEESLNKAMNATLAQAAVQVTQINKQLELNNATITDYGTQQALNIEKFDEHTKENLKYTEEIQKQLDTFKEIKELYDEQNEAFKLTAQIQEVIDKHFKSIGKQVEQLASNAHGAYEGFDTGAKTIDKYGKIVDKTTISKREFEKALHEVDGAFQKLSKTVQSYWVYFLKLTEATERFVTVNNRAYGSMHEIVSQAHLTALSYGLLAESALKATEALINVGVDKTSLEELTVALVETNRVTGLNYESLAELTRQYEATGEGAEGYKKAIHLVTSAQRAFSLSVGQTQKVLDLHNASLFRTTHMLGTEAPKEILKSLLAMQAMTRDTGAASSVLENFAKQLNATGVEAIELYSQIGADPFAETAQREEALLKFYDARAKALIKLGDANSAQFRRAAGYMKAEMDQRGLDMGMILNLAAVRRQANMAHLSAVEIQELYKKQIKEGKDLNGEYLIGMQGLTAQWNIFREAMTNALNVVFNWIADGMWPWIRAINVVIQKMAQVAEAILNGYRWLEKWIPGLKTFRGYIQVIIGGLILFTGVVVILSAAISSAIIAFTLWISSIILAGAAIIGLGGSIATFFTGAAASVNAFLTRVAGALSRLGAMLTPLIGPMLAFGASILMVGAGTFLLAKAFEAVAQYGWQGVAMFFAFMAVVALFGLAIVGLGYLSIAAAPGLLALGAAILMIGVGVALMVGSVALLVMAFTGLLNAITTDIKDRIIGLTEGLLYLASNGVTIAFGLGLIGLSLASVMIPLGLASLALVAIGSSLSAIANFKAPAIGDELNKLADEILSATGKLTEAGWALIPAATALIVGSVALMGSAYSLAIASAVMYGAGVILSAAGSMFVIGTGLFFTGATMFKTGADFVLAGANTLIAGAKLIPEAAGLLSVASIELWAAGLALMPGSIVLAEASAYLAIAGLALALAAPTLMSGAIGFYFAADTISKGIEKLEKSSIILYRFAIAARALERLSFAGMRSGINDLGSSASEIDKYVSDMEKASLSLQNVRFDVTGFSNSIIVASNALTAAVDKLQVPIDKLTRNINEMVTQIDKLVAQEARVNELGANLNSAMPDKPDNIQQPAEFKKADGNTDVVNNIIEVKNDSSEMVILLKRLVALAEGDKEDKEAPEYGSLMTSTSPSRRLQEIGIDI